MKYINKLQKFMRGRYGPDELYNFFSISQQYLGNNSLKHLIIYLYSCSNNSISILIPLLYLSKKCHIVPSPYTKLHVPV